MIQFLERNPKWTLINEKVGNVLEALGELSGCSGCLPAKLEDSSNTIHAGQFPLRLAARSRGEYNEVGDVLVDGIPKDNCYPCR
jgi:hypothetical protein